MRIKMLCLSVAILFLLSGCGTQTNEQTSLDSATTSAATTTTITTSTIASTTNNTAETTSPATESSATASNGESIATESSQTSHVATSATTTASSTNATQTATTTTSSTVTATSSTTPETITFKATVRENSQNKTVSGVTVTVYTNGNDTPVGSAVTDQSGVARISMTKANSYRVVLSNLPAGYEANEDYRFSANTVNITIRKAAVQNEADHSQAQYAVGKKMTNFTLTDTDGNIYTLYDLLKEKQLVVLDFWYTSCEPCKMEFPYFEAAVQKYGNKMQLLAIDPIDTVSAITRLRDQLNANSKTAVTFPMLRDTCKLYLGFSVSTYPTTVFIDANGVIVDIHIGAYPSESAFCSAVERYIH